MWKKNESNGPSSELTPPAAPVYHPETTRKEIATIGPSITIKGDIAGEEDLEVQGNLEGNISIRKHTVTVAQSGNVKADIQAKAVHIAGEVKGNIIGDEEVVLRSSGRVLGNITAGRVTLENGSKFKGSIDMEPTSDATKRSLSASVDKLAGSPVERNLTKQTSTSKVN